MTVVTAPVVLTLVTPTGKRHAVQMATCSGQMWSLCGQVDSSNGKLKPGTSVTCLSCERAVFAWAVGYWRQLAKAERAQRVHP